MPLVVWWAGGPSEQLHEVLWGPPNRLHWGLRVSPSPVHVFRDHRGPKELERTSSPLHDVHQERFGLLPVNQRLSSGDDPLFPCWIVCPSFPPAFP